MHSATLLLLFAALIVCLSTALPGVQAEEKKEKEKVEKPENKEVKEPKDSKEEETGEEGKAKAEPKSGAISLMKSGGLQSFISLVVAYAILSLH